MEDFYLTIAKSALIEFKVKGSRFVAEARGLENLDKADAVIREIRKREHAATHHCFAYLIGVGTQSEFKYSDDGEPNGTAGKPIYDCLTGRNLTNVIVVVTRYFGGTKLGTGGLARAYVEAATKVLEISGEKTIFLTDTLTMQCDIKFYVRIQRLLQNYAAEIKNSEFSESVNLTVAVRKSKTLELQKGIIDLTHGQAKFK